MQNEVQQLPVPMVSNQSQVQQQLSSLNIQNNIASTGVLSSTGLMSSMPHVGDSLSETGNASGGDWQEEIYQKIKPMNELYFPDLNDMYQRIADKLQQHESLPQQPKNEQLEKFRFFKDMLEHLIKFLRTNKNDIQPSYREKAVGVEKQIVQILNSNRPRKPVSSLQQGQLPQPLTHAVQQSQQ